MAEQFVLEKLKMSSQAPGTLIGYIEGFKTHENLVKDKLFTVEDMQIAIKKALYYWNQNANTEYEAINDILQHLLPKTEWAIKEITSEGKIILNN